MGKKIDINKLDRHQKLFEVPDGYFESLQGKIQARIQGENPGTQSVWIPRLAWVAPIVLLVTGYFFFADKGNQVQSAEGLLAGVSTLDILEYLEDEGISEDEIINFIDNSDMDINFEHSETELLEDISEEELDNILDSYDFL